ncbi:serine/threonine protein kinase [Lentzea tibetensis]|uniref:non-specific serine/threonine protein kinase n=1 Tax=Lentzea tibetensis TaxID=2591470 RepID=A0A563ESV7_9PSEU|nr:serine/threonine-protein kinase [Lentzea tibetensis]TWP50692.1 serine/threonine protein kinase [Lentzea tibetensis]
MTEGLPEIAGFRYVQRLGRGGCSSVHLFHDAGSDRNVAVKVLDDPALPPLLRERFVAEARAAAVLGNHSNVVTVYQAGETREGQLYVAMRYCPNPDLGRLVANTPLPADSVLAVGVQIAGAVQAAHEMRVLHRDIRPANILVDENRKPCLTGFGIAGQLATRQTKRDALLSVPWSAPEVIRPTGATGANGVSAEVFSLGATLWHLLAGHSPFVVPHGDNTRSVIEARILHGSPRPTGRAPRSMEELLRRAMAPNPLARPRSVGEFAAELQAVQRELSGTTTPFVSDVDPVPLVEPSRLKASTPIFIAQPPIPVVHAKGEAMAAREEKPQRRTRWPVYAGASAAGVAAVTVGVILLSGNGASSGNSPAIDSGAQPNAAVDSTAPGKPAITSTRLGAGTLRFTWTYANQEPTDTFTWRTTDELKTGTATAPTLDLAATGALCIEVKVVRADGTTSADWSPEGCGS